MGDDKWRSKSVDVPHEPFSQPHHPPLPLTQPSRVNSGVHCSPRKADSQTSLPSMSPSPNSPRTPVAFSRSRSNSRESSSLPCLSPKSPMEPRGGGVGGTPSPSGKGSGPLRMSSTLSQSPAPFIKQGSLPGIFSISKMSKDLGLTQGGEVDIEKELMVILSNMDRTGDKKVAIEDLREVLEAAGLHPILLEAAEKIIDEDGDGEICFEEILKLRTPSNRWIFKALVNDLAIRDNESFSSVLNQCFEDADIDPQNAFLAKCNANMTKQKSTEFAAAFCSVDGQYWSRGEAQEKFTLQEASFPIMYCMAIELVGAERVHAIVGREPRGQGTSEYEMDKFGKPHNPMISLGAIATASLVEPEMDLADRFKVMTEAWNKLTASSGGPVTFDNFNYLKDSEAAVKEYSLAYGAKEKSTFPGVETHDDLTSLLRFHFMCEAIELDCAQLSIVAATLARGGINPLSRKRVFDSETAQHCLSVLFACGLKELTGAFAFEIGLPAKCGASGALMVVIPGVGGLALYSPLVSGEDQISMKGITFCHELLRHFPFHIFDSESTKLDQVSSEYAVADVYQLIYSAANGDLACVRKLVHLRGLDVNSTDYDDRTPLHLAVAERRLNVVNFLLENGAFVRCADRWGRTPLDEAEGDEGLLKLLQSFDVQMFTLE